MPVQYNITTNASVNEELAIQWKVTEYNSRELAVNPAFNPLTAQQFLTQTLNDSIRQFKLEYKNKLRSDAADNVVFDESK